MATRTSAGILLYRQVDGTLEVLLAHPGGPFFEKRDQDVWSIPKGEQDEGESMIDVAQREFVEETGHPVPTGPRLELGSIVQKGGKVVHAWAVEGDLDPEAAVSNRFEMEWPPRSGSGASSRRSIVWPGSTRSRRASGSRRRRSRSSSGSRRSSPNAAEAADAVQAVIHCLGSERHDVHRGNVMADAKR